MNVVTWLFLEIITVFYRVVHNTQTIKHVVSKSYVNLKAIMVPYKSASKKNGNATRFYSKSKPS